MARASQLEDKRQLGEILRGIKAREGDRRLTSPLSYYMQRRLREMNMATLVKTDKTSTKGKKPSLLVLTAEGKRLAALSSRWAAKAKDDKPAKAKSKKDAAETVKGKKSA